MNSNDRQKEIQKWAMLIHFSLLSGLVVPYLGFAAPIILWQIKKDEFPEIDAHGRMVTNWIITSVIYSVICGVLSIVVIGLLLIPILIGMSLVFPVIGGIKANEGKLWKYPLTISFL